MPASAVAGEPDRERRHRWVDPRPRQPRLHGRRAGRENGWKYHYIPTWEGWLYLATVIDCHTKKVVGYAMDDNYKTPLIVEAVRMAARNVTFADNAIFHSDRGSNYTSTSFAAALAEHGARQSVGRTGICYDNAMAESFFGTLKNERVHRTVYPTRERARPTSPSTSSSATIPGDSTQDSATAHRKKFTTLG